MGLEARLARVEARTNEAAVEAAVGRAAEYLAGRFGWTFAEARARVEAGAQRCAELHHALGSLEAAQQHLLAELGCTGADLERVAARRAAWASGGREGSGTRE
jgi:hypothetical protein